MKKFAVVVGVALLLGACASKDQDRMEDIAKTPLRDLNIKKVDVPAVLREAVEKPYAMPSDLSCTALSNQVLALDELLGPDIDAPEIKLETEEAAQAELRKAAGGALQNTVEGAIPFRGWLRKLSGAERHTRRVQEAMLAGKIRRGYLKGVMQSRSCSVA